MDLFVSRRICSLRFDLQNFFCRLSSIASSCGTNISFPENLNLISERNRLRKFLQCTHFINFKPELDRLKSDIYDKIKDFGANFGVTAIGQVTEDPLIFSFLRCSRTTRILTLDDAGVIIDSNQVKFKLFVIQLGLQFPPNLLALLAI